MGGNWTYSSKTKQVQLPMFCGRSGVFELLFQKQQLEYSLEEKYAVSNIPHIKELAPFSLMSKDVALINMFDDKLHSSNGVLLHLNEMGSDAHAYTCEELNENVWIDQYTVTDLGYQQIPLTLLFEVAQML